jgi:hypothetical protein
MLLTWLSNFCKPCSGKFQYSKAGKKNKAHPFIYSTAHVRKLANHMFCSISCPPLKFPGNTSTGLWGVSYDFVSLVATASASIDATSVLMSATPSVILVLSIAFASTSTSITQSGSLLLGLWNRQLASLENLSKTPLSCLDIGTHQLFI